MPRTTKAAAKKPRKTKSTTTRAKRKSRATKTSRSVTARAKTTALKILAGAASGAVQALIPPLEEAAERTAQSAGTAEAGGRQAASGSRKRK